MRLRRLCLAALASAVSLLAACAVPEKTADTEKDKVAAVPRDCEPQTGTRLPASCTKRGGSAGSTGSGSVQTSDRPSKVEMR
jgi:hypothetical protein